MTIDDRSLGEELIRRGLIDAVQLESARVLREGSTSLADQFVASGFVEQDTMEAVLQSLAEPPQAAIAIDAEPDVAAIALEDEQEFAAISVGEPAANGLPAESRPAAITLGEADDAASIAIGDEEYSEDSALEHAQQSVAEASVSMSHTGPFKEPATPEVSLAQKIDEKRVTTAAVLGLGDEGLEALRAGSVESAAVSRQITKFLERLKIREQQISDLKTCKADNPEYGKWLIQLERAGKAPDAATKLLALIDAEREEIALADLWNKILVYLDDDILEWAEQKKAIWNAEQLGLTEDHVEDLYARWIAEHGEFKRETEQEAAATAHSGWRAHIMLAGEGEVWAWSLERLQDAMVQRFPAAVEVANMAPEIGHSLTFYIEQWTPDLKTYADRAFYHASDLGCPQLAVWYFLWGTGQHDLHVGGDGLGPVAEQRRCVSSPDLLFQLVCTDWVVDDLGELLAAGLLEHWLNLAAGAPDIVVKQAKKAREDAKRQVTSERKAFLRREVTRLLWKMGFEGMPLRDDAGQTVIVTDIAGVLQHADVCWEDLEWCLQNKVLMQWLNTRDLSLGAWAERCERLA